MILAKIPIDLVALETVRTHLSLPLGDHARDYMIHTALKEAFKEDLLTYWIDPAPKGDRQSVLAYLEQVSWDEISHDAILAKEIQTKDFPTSAIAMAASAHFEIEVAPVRRSDRGERDAFLAHLEWSKAAEGRTALERGELYTRWLEERLSHKKLEVEPGGIEYAGFKLDTVLRRTHSSGNHPRKSASIKQPVARFFVRASFGGDVASVDALIRRGVGRHRGYGRGMPRFYATR